MAVPGSVRNKAADGTNQLLVDGCAPARDVTDVLVALGLSEIAVATRRSESLAVAEPGTAGGGCVADYGAALTRRGAVVLEAIDDGPTSLDEVVHRTGLGVIDVYARVEELVATGLVVHDGSRVRRQY